MWGRRGRGRFSRTPSKRHYSITGENVGTSIAICKKEYEAGTYTTSDVFQVTCKNCIKRMVRDGIVTLEQLPTHLHPATPVTKTKTKDSEGEFDINDYKNDYLKRLGVFK